MKLGLLIIRAAVGLLFAGHGAQKLFGSFGGGGPEGTGQFFEMVGLKPGRQLAMGAGASELAGGSLLALGLFTPLASTLLSGTMCTAIWSVHRKNGPWVTDQGYEYNLVLLAAVFAITDVGPGDWSLDGARGSDRHGTGWALAQLAAGAAGSAGLLASTGGQETGQGPMEAATGGA